MERLVFVGLLCHLSAYRLIWFFAAVRLCRAAQVVTQDEEELLNTPASLRCSLQNSEEVLIVTWQKIKAVSPENMVTFSKNHGVVVQPAYKDKINITQLELKNSTITFWNTTLEDEGCYKCLFNTFGSGKISGKACLTLSVQPTVFLHYKFFEDHVNITCSANARPAPVISWKVSGSGIENSTEILSHPNGTTSVTSVLQVKDPKSQVGKEVICQVLHLGTMTSVRQTLDKASYDFVSPFSPLNIYRLLVFSSTIVKYCFPGHSPGLNLNLIILETSSEPRPRAVEDSHRTLNIMSWST
ncbi:OX-2 membrane glycoprotein isoform X1 [Panthera leo]|uniref:OX-2 membrane glycoprotein isoform X1 n=2 Tax=Panthera leo TaxID=9689 RepID=UPI001C69692C|nr:OX-2 membrane glycoprotein isoform X1 [Panthera leo]